MLHQLRGPRPCARRTTAPRAVARAAPLRVAADESMTEAYARIRASRAKSKAAYERAERAEKAGGLGKFFNSVVSALDFQVDIAADREALADARRLEKGVRLSAKSEAALKRKVGGTKSNFFGETVDVAGKYRDSGYVGEESNAPPYALFLGLVVIGVAAATAVVVSRTG